MANRGAVVREQRRSSSLTELLYSLCSLYANNKGQDGVSHLYRHSLSVLGCHISSSVIPDEFRLSERIQKQFVQQHREGAAVTFLELHRKLSAQHVIKNRYAVLSFLLAVGDEAGGQHGGNIPSQSSLLLNAGGLSSSILLSSGHLPSRHTMVAPAESLHSSASASQTLVGSSGISSLGSGVLSMHSVPRGFHSSQSTLSTTTSLPQFSSTPAPGNVRTNGPPPPTLGKSREAWSEIKPNPMSHHVLPSSRGPPDKHGAKLDKGTVEVTEAALLRDIIFVFQNIEGDYIHFDRKQEAYRVDEKVVLPPSVRDLCHKLAELGWLYQKVRHFIDSKTKDKSQGLVCQSFCSALSQELTEYYRLIAVLEAQQAQSAVVQVGGSEGVGSLTLRRLVVWTHDPLKRLKILGTVVDGCKRLKGGALVSTLYAYSQHGDPYVSSLVKHLLNQVYLPINTMLNSWIFDGEMIDKSFEFFIACDESSKQEKLWRSKYSLRYSMLPSFISKELAQKILIIGKSINFLRQSCQDHTQLGGGALRTWYISEEGQSTFDSMTGAGLHAVVDTAYQETSKHLLHVLNTKYCFMEHLKALRRYLLMGQGDFIRHLMDLLAPELSKPATMLYLHNLTGTLETAIRATNAQFEAIDILHRLDVRMLDVSPGDHGWDVFSLHYHVDGPISTVFTAETMLKYLRVFNFLWRAKRMEYCLANMWRDQTSHHRGLHTIPELRPVLHQCHLLISSMVHFISQLQYYITFEVMECSWAGLVRKVSAAEDLDQVISAHDKFLEQITAQCLLDQESQPILTRLRAIFDLITMFQQKQAVMFSECLPEVERRRRGEEEKERKGGEGRWGTDKRESEAEVRRRRQFAEKRISAFRSEFVVLQDSFKDMIEEFMGKLTRHSEQSLRFLRFRLDFNEYYSTTASTPGSTPLKTRR